MMDSAAKLVYAKRWLEKNEADLLAELDCAMVDCGLDDAAATCIGWKPKFVELPARFTDPDTNKVVISFRLVDNGPFGTVKMVAELLTPIIDSVVDGELATKVDALDRIARDLAVVSDWLQADGEYERVLQDAKGSF